MSFHDITIDGKKFILEIISKDSVPHTVELTECSQYPDEIEMLEAYEFRNVLA